MLPWTTLQWHSWSGTLVLWEWFVSTGRVLFGSSRHISLWSVLSWPWCSLSTFLNGLPGLSWLSFQSMVSLGARHSNGSCGGNFFYSLIFPLLWLDLKKKVCVCARVCVSSKVADKVITDFINKIMVLNWDQFSAAEGSVLLYDPIFFHVSWTLQILWGGELK